MRIIFSVVLSFVFWSGFSQQFSNVIVACGGRFESVAPFSDRAVIGTYNKEWGKFWVFDTIEVEAVQDLVIEGNIAYLAATDSIIKYDLTTYERVGAIYFEGIKSLYVKGTHLFVGKWYGTGAYLVVYNKNTLTPIFSIPEINTTVNDMAIIGDSAYVSFNKKGTIDQFPPFEIYNDSLGQIGVFSVNSQTYVRTINLDTTGVGINKMFAKGTNIYAVCDEKKKIYHYNNSTNNSVFYEVNATQGTALVDSLIYANLGTGLGSFNLNTNTIENNSFIANSYIVSAFDTLNKAFVFADSDYATYGKVAIYNETGQPTDSFDVNIATDAIGVAYKSGNYKPFAVADYLLALKEVASTLEVLDNDFDPNGNQDSISVITYPKNGDIVENNALIYTPNAGYLGLDSLQYRICDTDGLCDSAWAKIEVVSVLGAISKENEIKFTIFPNPNDGVFNVRLQQDGVLNVVTLTGEIIYEKQAFKGIEEINLSSYSKGIYLLLVRNENGIKTQKIIIQ